MVFLQVILNFFKKIGETISSKDIEIASKVIDGIIEKLSMLSNLGLGYLNINRRTDTLSGGEFQKLKLANQIISNLTGITYILDEPTIGLHPADTFRIKNILNSIRENGNTIILVEHDPDLIKSADHIIDVGPEAGENGGKIIAEGNPEQVSEINGSFTGNFLKDIINTRLKKTA